jgi:hypothetical protein
MVRRLSLLREKTRERPIFENVHLSLFLLSLHRWCVFWLAKKMSLPPTTHTHVASCAVVYFQCFVKYFR